MELKKSVLFIIQARYNSIRFPGKVVEKINKNYKIILNKFRNLCYNNNISLLQACLHFIKQFKKIDYLVVGFEDCNQLREIINDFK